MRPAAAAAAILLTLGGASTAFGQEPLYYQDPDGKPFYAAGPKKASDGRNFVPVYEDGPYTAPKSAERGRVLYYRNPMGLPDTSKDPKKDSMGMDYIPVYENEAASGTVTVPPGRVQMLGVRTAPVETRAALTRTVRASGTTQFDERTVAVASTKVGGWIERLHVSASGDAVRRGDVLAEIYAPDLVASEEEYLLAARISGGLAAAALQRLRVLDVPEEEIIRLRRTGRASRRVEIRAPADGVVTEKAAVGGMRVSPDQPLYRTADLSTVWLIAEVQEQDLGQVRPGEQARARFVAFPSRVFEGVVDFVYPSLSMETRTGRVRIVVPNPEHRLRAGMYADVAIEAPAAADGPILAVPSSAVLDSGSRQAVLVERGPGRFEPRHVRIGARHDGETQVLEGLSPGERVVVGANFLIDSESNLRAALQSLAIGQGGEFR